MKIEENNNIIKEERKGGFYVRQRYVLAAMTFLGVCNVSFLRNNVNVAILAMVNVTHANSTHTVSHLGPFNWDTKQQGTFLGAYFYGYIVGNIPGGWMASKYGFKNVFGLSILISSVISFLTPPAAYASFYLVIACRALTGLLQGSSAPAVTYAWSRWAPPLERSVLTSISLSGILFGFVIIFPVAGVIADYIGWEAVFYFTGGIGIVWCIFFFMFITDSPSNNRLISIQEREFIERSIGNPKIERKKISIPWLSIVTSPCVWGLCAAHFADAWYQYTLPAVLPTYMVDVFHFNISESGFVMMLPFLAQLIVALMSGHVTDFLRRRKFVSTTCIRKINTSLAMTIAGILAGVTGYVGGDHNVIIAIFTLSFAISGLTYSGYLSNGLDIAPRHGGMVMGITNTVASFTGFLGPLTAGYVVTDQNDVSQWQIVFWIIGAINLAGATIYLILGSGIEQEWAKVDCEEVFDEKETKSNDVEYYDETVALT